MIQVEEVSVDLLKPHPRNYRKHPSDQLDHIEASIRSHGFYRNVVVARDDTILAGHGVVEAAKRMGLKVVPVVRMNVDPTDAKALSLLAGDNEISNLGEVDNTLLTELLEELSFDGEALLGTGFDEATLAGLVYVSTPEARDSEFDSEVEWSDAGLPEYGKQAQNLYKVNFNFPDEKSRNEFLKKIGVDDDVIACTKKKTVSYHWPFRTERYDWTSLKFSSDDEESET